MDYDKPAGFTAEFAKDKPADETFELEEEILEPQTEAEVEEEPKKTEKPKKRGFFSKLGRKKK